MPRSVFLGVILICASGVMVGAHAQDAGKDCLSHYTAEGNFLTGKKFSAWAAYADVPKADAYSRIYASLAKDGWTIVNADKEAGIISASQQVSFGKGSTAPLVILVEPDKSGSKATATFRIGGGQATSGDTVKTKLCGYLDAAAAK